MSARSKLKERMLDYDGLFESNYAGPADMELVMDACAERSTDSIDEISLIAALCAKDKKAYDCCKRFLNDYVSAVWCHKMYDNDNPVNPDGYID